MAETLSPRQGRVARQRVEVISRPQFQALIEPGISVRIECQDRAVARLWAEPFWRCGTGPPSAIIASRDDGGGAAESAIPRVLLSITPVAASLEPMRPSRTACLISRSSTRLLGTAEILAHARSYEGPPARL